MKLKLFIPMIAIILSVLIPSVFSVSNVVCGQILTSSITMNDSLIGCAGDGLIINASDVTLDCAGFIINATGIVNGGIKLTSLADNSVIQSCKVEGFEHGIHASGVDRFGDNLTNVTIQNFNWDTNFNGILIDASGTSFNNNFIIQDSSGFSGQNGIELHGVNSFTIERMNYTCNQLSIGCNNGIISEETIPDGTYVIRDIIFLKGNTIGVEIGLLFASDTTNLVVLIEDFLIEANGQGLLQQGANVTLRRGKIEFTQFAILQDGAEDFTFVENVTYPITNLSQQVTGNIFRSWDSTVQTNIPNVDINLTSNQAVLTILNTGVNSSATINLLEYELDVSLVKTDSTPYNVTATFETQTFEGILTLGSLFNNSIEFNQFTVSIPPITGQAVLPLENATSLVGMVALFILIVGLIFSKGIFKRK